MKKLVTNSPRGSRLRNAKQVRTLLKPICFSLACLALLSVALSPRISQAQNAGAFIENNGLVVMETESVDRPFNWNFENSLDGFTGDGYLRYIGANHFNEPGIDVLEFDIVIEHPGEYKMFLWSSHIDAPEPDQNNDAWTKMNDGEWIKTVHPGVRQEEGFTFHTQWVQIVDGVEIFSEPTYQLDAGVHTFYISGRSWSFRIDRIHIWKNDDPFKVSYDTAAMNTHPESERDNTILTVSPDPVTFNPTAIGLSSQISASLNNEGDESINISSVSVTGDNASEFSTDFSGSLSVPANSFSNLNVTLAPTSHGTKVATMTITHDGLNSPTNVNLFGTATSGGSGTTVLFRVNAGGPLIADAEGDWEEDQVAAPGHNNGNAALGTPHPYVNAVANGDWSFGRDDDITLDFSVPPGTPAALFQRGRWDPTNLPTQQWDIPVDAGTEVEVRLYFAEQLFTAPDVPADQGWPRVFDVEIDGIVYAPFDDLNIFDQVGHDVGMMRSVVLISDGNVDINLLNDSHDPILQGIEILEVGSISRAMDEGWNLVGLPTAPSNSDYTSVFNEVSILGEPFLWDGSNYVQTPTIESGKGYWLKLSEGGSQSFSDASVNDLTLSLSSGWNLIAGPACVIPWEDISDPGNILIDGTLYSYSDGYVLSTALLPGSGYWLRTTGAGSITMDCSAVGKTGAANVYEQADETLAEFGRLLVSDRSGKRQQLFFGAKLDENIDARSFSMPPKGQVGDFDVRFHDSSRLSQADEHIVRIQSSNYPVVVKLDQKPAMQHGPVMLEELVNGEVVKTHLLENDEAVTVSNTALNALRIRRIDDVAGEVPNAFELKGNYPNPFNPSTQLVFDMPDAGVVRVEVYDLLGRHVMSVPAQDIAAGAGRRIMLDASSLASGTYLYHLTVEMASTSATQVGRMTLIK